MLVSRLTRDGAVIGFANWFAKEQLLIWDIPGVTSGSLTGGHLKSFGGWPFTPDAEWLNLQTIAFYHFKTAIDKQGLVAARPPAASWPERALNLLIAPVQANEPGCDGLHWLDGTVLGYAAMCTTSATKNMDARHRLGGECGQAGRALPATLALCGASVAAVPVRVPFSPTLSEGSP